MKNARPIEDFKRAYELRNDGHTWKEIGAYFAVSRERASQMARKYERLSTNKHTSSWTDGLSVRVGNILKCWNYESKAAVMAHIRQKGTLTDIIGIGAKREKEIFNWLGIN